MKQLSAFLLFSVVTATSLVNASEYPMVFTDKGYPYKDLIQRTEEVKIIYTENDQSITCRVEVNIDGVDLTSQKLTISKKAFKETPLASCISRKRARQMLAATFK